MLVDPTHNLIKSTSNFLHTERESRTGQIRKMGTKVNHVTTAGLASNHRLTCNDLFGSESGGWPQMYISMGFVGHVWFMVLQGSRTNPYGMEFGQQPAQQHTSHKEFKITNMQGGGLILVNI